MDKTETTKEFIEKIQALMEEYGFTMEVESKVIFKKKDDNRTTK